MADDVKSTQRTTTGTAHATRARLRAVYYVGAADAGTITFKDGGGSGTTRLTLTTPASAGTFATDTVSIPGDGILFETDLHVTVSNATAVTVIFSG